MSRLDTIRTYFIERFLALLTSDPEFSGLSEPSELFGTGGAWDVPANALGFVRIPTLRALDKRIASVSSAAQKAELERFRRGLARTLHQLFGSLADVPAEVVLNWAARFSPMVRHPDTQKYWPVDVGRYLGVDDRTLQARYYDANGDQRLAGRLYELMFENPTLWAGAGATKEPFVARVPFVATIGIDASVSPFPTSPLTAGHLNLPAADARLTPDSMPPTIFVEVKSLVAALQVNRHYTQTAEAGGRFQALRHNRIQTDPLLSGDVADNARPEVLMATRVGDPVMLIFHGFYPADDGARRVADGTGTNREFHHLAVGLLAFSKDDLAGPNLPRKGLLFTSRSPTAAHVLPLGHPSLHFVDKGGNEHVAGSHPVIFANTLTIQGYAPSGDNVDTDRLIENALEALDYDLDDWQWWVGLASSAAAGAASGSPYGWGGAAIGAAVGALAYVVAWLLKKVFSGSEDRTQEWTEQDPWLGMRGSSSYQQSSTNDIGPPGTTLQTGGTKPGRSYELKMIPHFPDDNLYGLDFASGDTFRVVEDAARRETLAWHAFEGGIGYQFERPLPGRSEVAGTSIRSYFDVFLRKYLELRTAQSEVSYFGS